MAIIYVSAVDGVNTDSGADWANAKQSVAGALAIFAAGDIIYVDNAGTFAPVAAITWSMPNGYVPIISVDRANSDAWAAGAVENAANATFTIAKASTASGYVFGMVFAMDTTGNQAGTALNVFTTAATTGGRLELDGCTSRFGSTNPTAGLVRLGTADGADARHDVLVLRNHNFVIPNHAGTSNIGQIQFGLAHIQIINPTFTYTGAGRPGTLFSCRSSDASAHDVLITGDLSGYVSGSYFNVTSMQGGKITLKNCKLHATPTLVAGTWAGNSSSIEAINVDSGDSYLTYQYRNRLGTLTVVTATYANAGAEHPDGTRFSWEVTTTAACNEANPFILPVMSVYNSVTSAQTAKVHFLHDSATPVTDREIWLELWYPASSSFPTGGVVSDRCATPFLAGAGADQGASSETWTESMANDNEQECSVGFTAGEKGVLDGCLHIAKGSWVVNVCPLLRVA